MKEFELVIGRNLPFKPNMADRITISDTQSRVNELMGISDMDFVTMKSKISPDESVEGDDGSILQVAKMMGLSAADIRRYGHKEPFSESETDSMNQVTVDEAVLQVSKMMGVNVEDIRKYGCK